MADVNNPHPPSHDRPADETIKETIESIVIAFILAFVFRAYVVEAFVIPTGSMAPTLLGAHMTVTCEQCGYHFVSDWSPEYAIPQGEGQTPRPIRRNEQLNYACPMCRYDNVFVGPESPRSGDRILVHKYLYTLTEPQRWDVVVFKNTASPHDNYIKRLVGLPNENLHIHEGNIYTQPIDPVTGTAGQWSIARKSDRPEVQRAVFQPVYHSQYIPLDGGTQGRTGNHRWSVPWNTSEPADWTLANARSYAHNTEGPGAIHFDFASMLRPIEPRHFSPAFYAYNQLHTPFDSEPIEDVRVAATIEAQGEDTAVRFSTTARLAGLSEGLQRHRLRVSWRRDGKLSLEALHPESNEPTPLAEAVVRPLQAGDRYNVELWYVDQQASVWIDGRRVIQHDFDADFALITSRPPLPNATTPAITIEVEGRVVLHEVEVDRDLFYQDQGESYARGYVNRASPTPLHIGGDEFFCVGDNGPRSYDGRYWREDRLHPWVRSQFLHERVARGEDPAGVVPRELMMGRAFFVYFPSPYSRGGIPLPNFGDMRFIH